MSFHEVFKNCFFCCSYSSAMNWNKGGPGVKRGFGFGGFSLSGKKEEPQLSQSSHTSFVPPGSSGKNQQLPSFYKIGSKRANFDEENAWVLSPQKIISGMFNHHNFICVIFPKLLWRWWRGVEQQCGFAVHPCWELSHTAADAGWWRFRQWRWPIGCFHDRGWGEKRI